MCLAIFPGLKGLMMSPNINNIAITAKGVNYRCVINGVRKSDATHLIEGSVLNDRKFIENAN